MKARVGLVDTIGRRVRLVRAGTVHKGLCPFHNEKTPSFTVDQRRGTYHCFGCGAHGNAIDFVMQSESLGFREAVEKLAGEVGLEIPKDSPAERERAERASTLHDVLDAAATFFAGQLADRRVGGEALRYLEGRGLDRAAIERFGLGYAPASRSALKSALGPRFPESLLIDAGLLRKPDDGSATYDWFRGRVMFPIWDARGRVVGFGGRVMGEGEPKYLNSPETDVFQKGRLLYGLNWAGPAARKTAEIIVVEGYMDVIALHLAGIETAVAPLGTALGETQIALLWRLAEEPILCFDGDAAGRRAAARSAERALPLLKPAHSLRFALLPPGEDPDSLVRSRGTAAMREILAAARPLRDLLWEGETTGRTLDTPERRAGLRQRLRDLVSRIEERSVQDAYRSEFDRACDAMFNPPRPARPAGGGYPPRAGTRRFGVGHPAAAPMVRPPPLSDSTATRESVLVLLALWFGPTVPEIAEGLGGLGFRNPQLEALRADLVTALVADRLDSSAIERHLTALGHGPTLDRLRPLGYRGGLASTRVETLPEEALFGWRDALIAWQRDEVQREIGEAQLRLSQTNASEDFQRLQRLQAQRDTLRREQSALDQEHQMMRRAETGRL